MVLLLWHKLPRESGSWAACAILSRTDLFLITYFASFVTTLPVKMIYYSATGEMDHLKNFHLLRFSKNVYLECELNVSWETKSMQWLGIQASETNWV